MNLVLLLYMVGDQLDLLIRRAADLPEDAQAELARSIAERLYHFEADDDQFAHSLWLVGSEANVASHPTKANDPWSEADRSPLLLVPLRLRYRCSSKNHAYLNPHSPDGATILSAPFPDSSLRFSML